MIFLSQKIMNKIIVKVLEYFFVLSCAMWRGKIGQRGTSLVFFKLGLNRRINSKTYTKYKD